MHPALQPDEDERILGALAHASIVANIVNLAGMIAATVIWATQRERSRFVRVHALQALAYQGVVLLLLVIMTAAWGACLVLSLLPAMLRPDLYTEGGPPVAFWFALLALLLPVGFAVVATLYGLYGAYRVYRGRPFRYPLVGRLVRAELGAPAQAAQPAAPNAPPAQPGEAAAPASLVLPPAPPAAEPQAAPSAAPPAAPSPEPQSATPAEPSAEPQGEPQGEPAKRRGRSRRLHAEDEPPGGGASQV